MSSQEEGYEAQERFQGFEYWKGKLLYLWPWELSKFYTKVLNNEDPIINEINFHSAVHYCFLERGYFNHYLTEEYHEHVLGLAEHMVGIVKAIFLREPEKLKRFEDACIAGKEV